MANLFKFGGLYDVIIEKQSAIRYFYPKPCHKITQTKHLKKKVKKRNILLSMLCATIILEVSTFSE